MRVIGHLDRVSPTEIRGWALDSDSPDPVVLEVRINGHLYDTVVANYLRPDVAAKGLHPTGNCGFIFKLPDDRQLGPADLVSVRVAGATKDISGSPMLCKMVSASPVAMPISTSPQAAVTPELPASAHPQSTFSLPDFPALPPPRERSSFRIFIDSFLALFLRTMKSRFGTQRFGYLLAVLEPLFYIILMRGSRLLAGRGGGFLREEGGVDGFYYHATGIISFFIFMRVFSSCLGSINATNAIFNYRQVKPIDAILVSAVIDLGLMLALFSFIVLVLVVLGRKVEADDLLGFLTAAGLLFLLGIGLGLLADVYTSKSPALKKFVEIVNRPLLFVSGAFFTMRDIPLLIKPYIIWNPILHGVDLCRGALLSAYDSPGDWIYLLTWVLASLWFGLAAYRRNLYRLTQA